MSSREELTRAVMSEGPWCNWCDKENPSEKHLEKHRRETDVTFTTEELAERDRQVAERAWDEAIQHQWEHRPIGNRSPHNPYRAAKGGAEVTRWATKVKRYGGGESVIGLFDHRFEAEEKRDTYNDGYQTDAAYVEEWRDAS